MLKMQNTNTNSFLLKTETVFAKQWSDCFPLCSVLSPWFPNFVSLCITNRPLNFNQLQVALKSLQDVAQQWCTAGTSAPPAVVDDKSASGALVQGKGSTLPLSGTWHGEHRELLGSWRHRQTCPGESWCQALSLEFAGSVHPCGTIPSLQARCQNVQACCYPKLLSRVKHKNKWQVTKLSCLRG